MIAKVAIIAIVLAVVAGAASSAFAHEAEAQADKVFGIVYVSAFVVADVIGIGILIWMLRRHRNPFTGLPRPIKRRRARGTLRRFTRLQ